MKRNREDAWGHKDAVFEPGISVLFLCLLLVIPLGCHKEEKAAAPQAPAVEVAEVIQKDIPAYMEWVGTLDGFVNATIRAQVQGYLIKRNYQEGDFVRRGQVLFEIDPREFQAAVDQSKAVQNQAKAALEQAKAMMEQAKGALEQSKAALEKSKAEVALQDARWTTTKANLARVKPLAEQNALSQKDLDDAVGAELSTRSAVDAAKAAVDASEANIVAAQAQVSGARANIVAAEAQVIAAEASLEKAQLNLSFTKVASPIDGISGKAKAQIGNLVGPGTVEELTTVSTVHPIKCYVALSEQEYMRITEGKRQQKEAKSKVPLDLILADGTTYPLKGEVYFADRHVDVRTGTIQVATIFPNSQNILRPGQFGRVRAEMGVKKGALAVPQRAVGELQGRFVVAVVGAENKVAIKAVKVGERVGQFWIVDEGLKPGDKVVAEGIQKVREGMSVTPKPFVMGEQKGADQGEESPKGGQKPGKAPEAGPEPKPGKR